MIFDYTHGNDQNYMVQAYRSVGNNDRWIFTEYRKAKQFITSQQNNENKGTILSLYNLNTDERKMFIKV